MNKEEKIEAIEEAQEKLYEAIELLEPIADTDANFKAYFLDQLKIMAGKGHGFLSRDLNLDKVREGIEDSEKED